MTEFSDPAPAEQPLVRRRTSVESAAAAGVVYAVLAVVSLVIVREVPDPESDAEWSAWISEPGHRRMLLVGLVAASVAAVAFLWFVAVVRRRVGRREDQFFATVFIGSALVQVALWLVAHASIAALAVDGGEHGAHIGAETASYARGFSSALLLVAGPRIQAVFVASTATIFLRTRIVPNWLAFVGYASAGVMFAMPLVATSVGLGLPVFVLVSSIVILVVADDRTERLEDARP